MWTNDPVADFMAHDAELERKLERLPECDYCGEAITDDYYFEINDDVICEGCLNGHYRKAVEDYVQ